MLKKLAAYLRFDKEMLQDIAGKVVTVPQRKELVQHLFTGRLLDVWAYRNKVMIEFLHPGKLTENECIELFNGSFRD